jgi:hypothetical protein
VTGAGDNDQSPRLPKSIVDALRVSVGGLAIVLAVDEQDGSLGRRYRKRDAVVVEWTTALGSAFGWRQ